VIKLRFIALFIVFVVLFSGCSLDNNIKGNESTLKTSNLPNTTSEIKTTEIKTDETKTTETKANETKASELASVKQSTEPVTNKQTPLISNDKVLEINFNKYLKEINSSNNVKVKIIERFTNNGDPDFREKIVSKATINEVFQKMDTKNECKDLPREIGNDMPKYQFNIKYTISGVKKEINITLSSKTEAWIYAGKDSENFSSDAQFMIYKFSENLEEFFAEIYAKS